MQRGRAKLRDLVRAGVEAAEEAGALDRARILRSVGDLGALTLRAAGTAETLVASAGSVAGGTLTSSDLEEATRRGAAGDRSGEGKGRGGGLGRCAVVVDGAEVSLTERPDGAAFTLRPRPGVELAELTKLAQDRAATTRKTRP